MTTTPSTEASIVAALEHCVNAGAVLPHQRQAFDRLAARLTPDQRQAFTRDWRAAPAANPYKPAVELIRDFEGFSSTAYPDPASGGEPWTIGYGFTTIDGRPVRRGDTMPQAAALARLDADVAAMAQRMTGRIPHWGAMNQGQRCALLSFAWNLGENFYNSDGFNTISKALRDRDWQNVPKALELYCNPGSNVEKGLRRRRRAEGALWTGGGGETTPSRQTILLDVPYLSQRDSATSQGDRMCYSSTCAMAAQFLKPGCLAGPGQPDDRYLALVQRFGDTTDAAAQVRTLESLGILASFRQDGTFQDLLQQLERRRPIAVGWLHKGPVHAPQGGGHWSLVVGWDPERAELIIHDPFGEANLVGGGYVSTAIGSGKAQRYSWANFSRRWMVGPQGGYAPGNGWWLQLD